MKIEIKIDESCREPKIIIVTDKMTEKINENGKKTCGGTAENDCGFPE